MNPVRDRADSNEQIDVTVILVTFNHAKWIESSVASVLSQRTGRRIELIISEDASTDGTREIVEKLAAADSRIRLILSPRNLRSNEPVKRAVDAARGRYLCLLDGDDRWLAEDKIERQADLLDADPHIAACFHNALIARGDAEQPSDSRWTRLATGARVTFSELWEGNPFATCAGMLRKSALNGLENWYIDCFPITDWPLYLLCAEKADMLFIDEPVGIYRLHAQGSVSGLAERERLHLIARFYRQMKKVRGGRWRKMARSGASLYFAGKARQFLDQGDRATARLCLRLALEGDSLSRSTALRAWLGLFRRSIW